MAQRGTAPRYLRSDPGRSWAHALRDWCRVRGAGTSYIEPGLPWENVYIGRLRDELLAVELFATLLETHVVIEDWRVEYNTPRVLPGRAA